MTERTRKIQQQKKHRERVRMFHVILTLFIICMIPVLLHMLAAALRKTAVVELRAASTDILQGEDMPELGVKVKITKDEDAVLDKKSKYTAADFVKDLENGRGYTLKCNADPKVEGTYKIKLTLDEEIAEKVTDDWKKHLKLTVKNGTFKVKNPVGEWDGDKFKKYDGSYVENAFVTSKGKKYYFGEDGTKVTGIQQIKNRTYFFDEKGVMKSGGWQKDGTDRYYLAKSGAAVTGWKDIKGASYYFDADGKMARGEIYIGLAQCLFDENGKLVSKKQMIDPDQPMVALTFDDGPGKRTNEVLDVLERYDAHATFFMLGQNVSRYKDEVKRMKEIGCELGNHSYDHTSLASLDASGVKKQISETNREIKKITGSAATVMRPPYGAINDTVKDNVGMPMILWNIDTLDWKTRDAKKTIQAGMKAEDGDVILVHDIHSETVDAVIKLIPKLEQAGFQLVTISEMAAAKDVELKNGGKYTDFTE